MSKKIKLFLIFYEKSGDIDYITSLNYQGLVWILTKYHKPKFWDLQLIEYPEGEQIYWNEDQINEWYDAWQESMAIAKECKEVPVNNNKKGVRL